jgi:hypothetical protein
MFERKVSAKVARSIFCEDYNDIDIYVEDSAIGYRKIYKEILRRSFGSEIKISNIYPIGSRSSVISECRNIANYNRKRLFIVDGDLDLLVDENNERIAGLFILPRYCIENYLIQEGAIVDVLYEEDPELEREQIADSLAFNRWIEHNDTVLTDLFVVYALCKCNIPEEPTVSYKVSLLCKDNSGEMCHVKTQLRIDALKQKIIDRIGEGAFNQQYRRINDRITYEAYKMLRYTSGKDYLFPLINVRLRNLLAIRSPNTALKVRLASKCDISDFHLIMNYIIE